MWLESGVGSKESNADRRIQRWPPTTGSQQQQHCQHARYLLTARYARQQPGEQGGERDAGQGGVDYDTALGGAGDGSFQYWLMLVCGWDNTIDEVEIIAVSFHLPAGECDLELSVGASIPVVWSYFAESQPSHRQGGALSVLLDGG